MEAHADRVEILSQERVTEELGKTLASPSPSTGLGLLYRTGLLERVLPEVTRLAGVEEVGGRAHKDNFWHTLEVVDNPALSSLAGLDNLEQLDSARFRDNPSLSAAEIEAFLIAHGLPSAFDEQDFCGNQGQAFS